LNNIKLWLYETFFDEENIISVHNPDNILETFEKESDRLNIKSELVRQQIEAVLSTLDTYSNPVIIRHKLKTAKR
jgi:hypothetical protein